MQCIKMYSLDDFLTIHGGFHGVLTYKNRVAYMAGILCPFTG